jgi:hypothetical protein
VEHYVAFAVRYKYVRREAAAEAAHHRAAKTGKYVETSNPNDAA